ncbi:hypothetical protein [Aurantiacibacter marinus]|uniref:DUF1570 domain-containing protein n=1 Tax=Aurantiacibacter marinus TaxID=874156 RepID=A0A0H0XMK7_9SPHN|nr:hypothetical protein [Aurantiacibacter marinus]KLI63197.1 hypothetical protein AAV99_10995 [Aurantiacibacter marinus]
MRLLSSFIAAVAVLAAIPAAAADWYRAETRHFIVYSEDSESDTREFVQDLERLDEVLRLMTGIGPDDGSLPESSKVTVFRFGETRDMAVLATGAGNSGVGGFFIGRASGSVAFVPRRQNQQRVRSASARVDSDLMLDPKATLFHEYVHYFMFQHGDAPYPLWYSEGFAELFSTLEFEDDYFVIGEVPSIRSFALSTISINLQDTFDPPARQTRQTTGRTYAHGWLLASHLNLNPDRRGQMGNYLAAISAGQTRMEAAATAFGDLEVLRQELEEFRQGASRILRVPYSVQAEPEVSIRRLDDAEAARMDLMIVQKRGVDEDEATRIVRDARRLVEEYPESAAVLLTAVEAEFDARNYDEAESLAGRVLALDPASTEAANYYADVALRRSFADASHFAAARTRFAAANRMETDHAYPLYGYYLSHALDESQTVTDQAKMALEAAFGYAPYDNTVRQALVYMLLEEGRPDEARMVGASFLDGQSGYRCLVRKKFDEFDAGNREPLLELFRPDHPGEYLDEAAREAQREEIEADIEAYGCEVD